MSGRAWIGAALFVALAFGSVVVFTVDEHASGSGPTPNESVTLFVTKGCVGCHRFEGQPGNSEVGPDLTALDKVAAYRVEGLTAEEYVRQSIRQPLAYRVPGYDFQMPTLSLTDAEVDEIVAMLLAPDED